MTRRHFFRETSSCRRPPDSTVWLIRKATSSDVSHAALHIGHGIAIEANDPGVVPVFLPVPGHERAARLVVKRMPNLTAQQREEIVSRVSELLYRPYSTRGALSTRLTFLRKASDPGRFCSQLVAESYASLGQPICQLTPEKSTPEDFLAATSLIEVEAAVKTIDAAIHAAVVSPYADRYARFLQSASLDERALLATLKSQLLISLPEESFNIGDLIRQIATASMPDEVRKRCDVIVTNGIRAMISANPLRPCPGIAIATYLFNPVPLPPINTWAGEIVMMTAEGRAAFTSTIEQAGAAAKWELNRWIDEAQKLFDANKTKGFASPVALAMWMTHAAIIRMKYSQLCAAGAKPGTVAPEDADKISEELRAFVDKDPVGAKEFSLDPFMLLQQRVFRSKGTER